MERGDEVTRVVHCKHETFDVYIGRKTRDMPRSIWGNPYVIGKDGTREEVIEKYREYIMGKPELLKQLESLRGKKLGCWCKPQKCHGDILIELLETRPTQSNLGLCVRCGAEASLRSPSGSVYCDRCGRCGRKVYGTMKGVIVLRQECKRSVEEFVLHPRMGIYVCPCVVQFEAKVSINVEIAAQS